MCTFNVGRWRIELTLSGNAFDFMYSLTANLNVLSHYVSSLVTNREDTTPSVPIGEVLEQEHIEKIKKFARVQIQRAQGVYNRQMIVVIATYIETMILEFIQCIFITHPTRMYEYLTPKSNKGDKGKIDLREIINVASKEQLLHSLAQRATSFALQGEFTSVIKTLEKVAKAKLDSKLSQALVTLMEQRNRIVHQASSETITSEQVDEVYIVAHDLLELLKELSDQNGILTEDVDEPIQISLQDLSILESD